MNHPIRALACASALPFLLVPFACAQAAPPENPLAKLVPPGTVVYLEVPSLERVEASVVKVMAQFAPSEAESFDIDAVIGEMSIGALPAKDIDHTKPIAFCLVLPAEAGAEPTPVLLLPAVSPDALVASAAESGAPIRVKIAGSYVLVSEGEEVSPGTAPAPIANGLPAGEIALRVDMKRLVEHFRPMIDMGLSQVEMMMDAEITKSSPMGMDLSPIAQLYVGAVRAFVDSGETLELAIRLDGTRFESVSSFTVLDKSPLAEWGSKTKADVRGLARLVDGNAMFSMVGAYDSAAIMKKLKPVWDSLVASFPEPPRESYQKLSASFDALAAEMGPTMCLNGDLASDGLRYAMYFQPRDAANLLSIYTSMLGSVPGVKLDEMRSSTIDGAAVSQSRLHLDAQALAALQSDATTPEETQAVNDMMQRMYGKDGLAFAFATKGDVTAVVLGGDDAFLRASLARLSGGGKPAPAMARGFERIGGLDPAFVVHYDFGKLMRGVTDLMPPGTPGMDEIPPIEAKVAAWGGIDGRTWRYDVSMDLAELGASVRAMEAAPATGK